MNYSTRITQSVDELRQLEAHQKLARQRGIDGLAEPTYQPASGKLSAVQLAQLQAWPRLDQATRTGLFN